MCVPVVLACGVCAGVGVQEVLKGGVVCPWLFLQAEVGMMEGRTGTLISELSGGNS